jgi:hypothetical protein
VIRASQSLLRCRFSQVAFFGLASVPVSQERAGIQTQWFVDPPGLPPASCVGSVLSANRLRSSLASRLVRGAMSAGRKYPLSFSLYLWGTLRRAVLAGARPLMHPNPTRDRGKKSRTLRPVVSDGHLSWLDPEQNHARGCARLFRDVNSVIQAQHNSRANQQGICMFNSVRLTVRPRYPKTNWTSCEFYWLKRMCRLAETCFAH